MHPVDDELPRSTSRLMEFPSGTAIGISNRWQAGQYCTILARAGLVGCGIYDVRTAEHFGQAVAICRGTPQHPLAEPEDLLEARIAEVSPQASALGIVPGMTGGEAVERLLQAQAR